MTGEWFFGQEMKNKGRVLGKCFLGQEMENKGCVAGRWRTTFRESWCGARVEVVPSLLGTAVFAFFYF